MIRALIYGRPNHFHSRIIFFVPPCVRVGECVCVCVSPFSSRWLVSLFSAFELHDFAIVSTRVFSLPRSLPLFAFASVSVVNRDSNHSRSVCHFHGRKMFTRSQINTFISTILFLCPFGSLHSGQSIKRAHFSNRRETVCKVISMKRRPEKVD